MPGSRYVTELHHLLIGGFGKKTSVHQGWAGGLTWGPSPDYQRPAIPRGNGMIRATKLSKFYGGKRALGAVSFEIADGETVGFLGLNGAGKTTALRILACDLRPSAGTIEVGGVDAVAEPHEVRKRIGFLPENPPLYTDMTVNDYLHFSGELRGMSKAAIKKRLGEVLEITD